MQIYDSTCNKIRQAKNFLLKHYTLPFLEEGKSIEKSVPGVQFTIVGNTREWTNWIELSDFQKHNPDVEIGGLAN